MSRDEASGGVIDYDTELYRHNLRLRAVYEIRSADRVLDIGCGAGQTTRDAARIAKAGSAHGVDLSAEMIKRAREITTAEGINNATFQRADAATSRPPNQPFDIAISRFGTMFFIDPISAFANIAQALRPAAKLVMMVWQARERNEWADAIDQALIGGELIPPSSPGTPDAFSLGNPEITNRILSSAGFTSPKFTDIEEPVNYGPDVDAALDFVTRFQSTKDTLEQLGPTSAKAAIDRLRKTLTTHQTSEGVVFDSRSWIVTAQRR